jgi:site-specific recombinase XerD
MRSDHSRAPERVAADTESFLAYLGLERGLSANTLAAYRRDLDQAADFLDARGAGSWLAVTPALASEWISSLGGLPCDEPCAETLRAAHAVPSPCARASP